MDCSTPGFRVLHHLRGLLRSMSFESGMLSDHLIWPPASPFAFSLSQHEGLFLCHGTYCLALPWVVGWSVLLTARFNERTSSDIGNAASGQAQIRFSTGWAPHMPICSVSKSGLTLCDPTGCSPPGSSVHEIFQARILEWVAISFSRGSSQPRDGTQVSCTVGRSFTD